MALPTFKQDFELKWRVGVRTATSIARIAGRFASEILLTHADVTASAKSIMGILLVMVADEDRRRLSEAYSRVASSEECEIISRDIGLKSGFHVTVSVHGADAVEAFEAMKELYTCGPRGDLCPHEGCSSPPILVDVDLRMVHYSCRHYHNGLSTGAILTRAIQRNLAISGIHP